MGAQASHPSPDLLDRILSRLSRCPRRVLDGVGYGAYFVTYHLLRWRRRLSLTNVANAFPEKTPAEQRAIVRQSYRNLGCFIAEALWGWSASAPELAERVRIVNPELVTRHTTQGRSVVLLAAHFCNWEWLLLAAGIEPRHTAAELVAAGVRTAERNEPSLPAARVMMSARQSAW